MFLNHHLRSAVILVLHVVPNNSEVRLRPPACLDLAAARESMALTLQKHVVVERLQIKKNKV